MHLELTILFALGILGEKPTWMDEKSVVRSDGVVWSRYWWPRPLPLEQRELLPAAKLPQDVLHRILPPDGPHLETGDLADALYERANHYADEECCRRALQTAMSQRNSAETSWLNQINMARQREMASQRVEIRVPGIAPHQTLNPPSHHMGFHPTPGMPSTHMGQQPFSHGMPHDPFDEMDPFSHHGGIFPHDSFSNGMGSRMSNIDADRHFAMTHGIFAIEDNGPLFSAMGMPKRTLFSTDLSAITASTGEG